MLLLLYIVYPLRVPTSGIGGVCFVRLGEELIRPSLLSNRFLLSKAIEIVGEVEDKFALILLHRLCSGKLTCILNQHSG